MTLICFLALSAMALSDELLFSSKENYPNGLLRSRITRVTVTIRGLAAETVAYQEFFNDWHDSTDAVYSFPLPLDAQATHSLPVRKLQPHARL